MKTGELRELDGDELIRKKAELKDQLFKLRFQHELGQLENAAKLQTVRRDIARIETILKEMQAKAKA
ncbi:MAG: 50S ribosomal protein L29 [Candidatus Aminicenantes bacterium]|jgi:large subunit ribosomal protein L29|nr:50S ribosomal protein L29 [Candidatus Aminicenantes bacterium]